MPHLHNSSLRVCSFESRRAADMRALIERHGGIATVAPSMREVPLEENQAALEFARQLIDGKIDVVVFMTGVGAQTLLEAVETTFNRVEFLSALDGCQIVVRGPKPTAVLHKWGTRIDCRAPEPNTWRELLAALDGAVPVAGKTVAIQEYGEPNEEFYKELQQRGAQVVPVEVYRWGFPEDPEPLRDAIQSTIAGEFDALLFTSAFQVESVLHAAAEANRRDEWIAAANQRVVASIGPTASEKLESVGLAVDLEASPPKMGQLVRLVMEQGLQVLEMKRTHA